MSLNLRVVEHHFVQLAPDIDLQHRGLEDAADVGVRFDEFVLKMLDGLLEVVDDLVALGDHRGGVLVAVDESLLKLFVTNMQDAIALCELLDHVILKLDDLELAADGVEELLRRLQLQLSFHEVFHEVKMHFTPIPAEMDYRDLEARQAQIDQESMVLIRRYKDNLAEV